MSSRGVRLMTLALVVFLSCPLPPVQAAKSKSKTKAAPPPAAVEPADEFPAAELTLGFQTGDAMTEGLGDLLIPLWNPGGAGLLFLNPRATITSHDEEEGNLGLGYRQLLPKATVILGANAYYDYRDTGMHHYGQWGFGLEMLTPWIDARANYYDPEDERNRVASETETSTRQTLQTTTDANDPYAEDHYVLQDYTITRTLTTLTTTRTFEQFEQAIGGYDWEIGVKLPLPVPAETAEMRVFGGMYDFERDFGDDIRGWKARAELRVCSSFFLDGGLYEDDELTGSDWFAGARLTVPLDLPKISQGRNPFATAKSRLGRESRDFASRLTEMVMRDSQIRMETSGFIENESLFTETTTRDRSTDSDLLVLMADVNFVDGDSGSASGDGTAERPFDTIQGAVDRAFGLRNVYVHDAARAYEENVVLSEGITLRGSGVRIPGLNGTSFGSGVAPIVDGMSLGPSLTLADRTTVLGFHVRNTDAGGAPHMVDLPVRGSTDVRRVGILGNGATDLTLVENAISGNAIGVLLARQGDFLLDFADNRVADNESGMEVWGAGNSGTFDVSIADSLFEGNAGAGLWISASTYDLSRVQIENSQFLDNGGNGLDVLQQDSLQAFVSLSGLRAEGNGNNGAHLQGQENDLYQASISGSEFTANNNHGLWFQADRNDVAGASISNSLFSGNAGDGAQLHAANNLEAAFHVESSAFTLNEGDGLEISTGQNASLVVSIADSQFSANDDSGLSILSVDDSTARFFVDNSLFANNGENGLRLEANGGLTGAVAVAGSAFTNNGSHGALLQATDNDAFLVDVQNSLFAQNAENGLGAEVAGGDLFQAAVDDSAFTGNAGNGLLLSSDGTDVFRASVEDGNFENNAMDGLQAVGRLGATAEVAIAGSTFTDNAGAGLSLAASGFDLAAAHLQDSAFADNAQDGATIQLSAGGEAALAMADVQAEGNGDSGIDVSLANLAEAWIGFSNVVANQNAQIGASIVVRDADEALIEIERLQADRNGGAGAVVDVIADAAVAAIVDSQANLNGGTGWDLDLQGETQIWVELDGIAANQNQGMGIDVATANAASSMVRLANIQALANEGHGIRASITGAEYAVAGVLDSVADSNAHGGVVLDLRGNALGMALISDSQANGNRNGDGFFTTVADADVALANLSGLTANNNSDAGVAMDLDGREFAIGLAGFPQFSLEDGLLPDEVGDLFIPTGPIEATGNQGAGVWANIHSEAVAAGAFFDIDSRENAGDGVYAHIHSSNGIAAALAGSSQNWTEILELGEDIAELLDLDLPVSLAGDGRMQASGNDGSGVLLNVEGGLASLTAAVGLETVDNGEFGVKLVNQSDLIAVSALARLTSRSNGIDGVRMNVQGDGLAAIGLLADVNASDNADDGIHATIDSEEGAAAFLALSTDALRPLASFIGELAGDDEYEMPGEAFGPVTATGNGANGLLANVEGADLAAAIVVDAQANDNAANGIRLVLDSADGTTLSAVLSSDMLYELVSEILPIGPIAFEPMGSVQANGNGSHGLRIVQSGEGPAYGVLLGIEANANQMDGINLDLASDDGGTFAVLMDIAAGANVTGQGISLHLHGQQDQTWASLVGVDASDNGAQGVRILASNDTGSAYAVLADVNASRNDSAGIRIDLQAAEEAVVALTAITARDNDGRGANLTLDAGLDAALFVGDDALVEAKAAYFTGLPSLIEDLYDLTPQGNAVFSDNGATGLRAELNSAGGDVSVMVGGANADGNDGAGFDFALNALNGDLLGEFSYVVANGNDGDGLNVVMTGAGATALASLDRVTAHDNDGNGIDLSQDYNGAEQMLGSRLWATNNTANGVRVNASGQAGAPVLDFGGGGFAGVGQSSIYGNGNRDFRNTGAGTVMAENNWWGTIAPANSQFGGSIDRTPWLVVDPYAP